LIADGEDPVVIQHRKEIEKFRNSLPKKKRTDEAWPTKRKVLVAIRKRPYLIFWLAVICTFYIFRSSHSLCIRLNTFLPLAGGGCIQKVNLFFQLQETKNNQPPHRRDEAAGHCDRA